MRVMILSVFCSNLLASGGGVIVCERAIHTYLSIDLWTGFCSRTRVDTQRRRVPDLIHDDDTRPCEQHRETRTHVSFWCALCCSLFSQFTPCSFSDLMIASQSGSHSFESKCAIRWHHTYSGCTHAYCSHTNGQQLVAQMFTTISSTFFAPF